MVRLLLTLLIAGSLAAQDGPRDPAALRIVILRGAGIVHPTGSSVSMPLAVEVTDQTGNPVQGAVVSLRLPSFGPSGTFLNGLTTDIVITGKDGRAAASKLRFNNTPGTVEVRLAAGKGPARGNATIALRLSNDDTHGEGELNYYSRKNKFKMVLIVAGAAAGSLVAGLAVAKK